MKHLLMAAVIASAAGAASAQTSSCGWEYGRWVCRDQSQPQMIQPNAGNWIGALEAGQRDGAMVAAQRAQMLEARRDRELTSAIGSRIADHRCEEARTIALNAGRLDLAERAQRLCDPPPAYAPTE